MTEAHHHCQCDNCDGVDCGQDDPENYVAEQKAQQEEHDAAIRKDERRNVLQGLLTAMNDPALSICDTGYLEHAYWSDFVRGLWEETKKSTVDLKGENKPGCFGTIGLPGQHNDPGCPCAWQERCRQSQEDE